MTATVPEAGPKLASTQRDSAADEDAAKSIVLLTHRHLKWRSFDILERVTMMLCGLCLLGFTSSVFFDVVTRTIGHPWLWLQEVTSTFFIYGIFIGAGVATRRNDHLYLTALTETMHGRTRLVAESFNRIVIIFAASCMVWFGLINFWQGLGSFRMPSMTPISTLYAAIPLSGILIALFAIEQLVNGWRNGFENPSGAAPEPRHFG
jgi:TRAP-type C4-dicarboxylate transport system permease small subunit